MTISSLRLVSALSALACFACQPRTPTARPPSDREAAAEQTVAASPPRELHIFADRGSATDATARYLLLGRDAAGSSYQPLTATLPAAATHFVPRAGHTTWVAGHTVEALIDDATADSAQKLSLRVSPRPGDAAAASPVQVALPAPCTQTAPALLQAEGERLHALLRCPKEGYALLLTLDDHGRLQTSRRVPAAADATLFLHQPDGDYLAVARQVLRVPKAAGSAQPDGQDDLLPIIGTVPPPGGDSDTRELIRSGELLLIVDGAAGRVIVMDAARMGWRTEKRFYSQGTVTRLRSVLTAPDRLLVVTAEQTKPGTELFATLIVLSDTSSQPPGRWQLGGVPRADHELVPIADSEGGGALLIYSRTGAGGATLVSRRLTP